MPVLLDRGASGYEVVAGANGRRGLSPLDFFSANIRRIDLALVNNMPDSALEATERQFVDLVDAAAGDTLVRLKFLSVPDVPRAEWARRHLRSACADIGSLWDSRFDGLIVTGNEPRSAVLTQEPYWNTLARIVDWARDHTVSTVWSCLAAHAAVLHMDGIERRPLGEKRSGVFDCANVSRHALMKGAPRRFRMPHSRYNELPEQALTACGYAVLTASTAAGVDTFVKQANSLFVFFQGHPEYQAETLLREYRRDVGRFLEGERDTYPAMPQGYFDAPATETLAAFRARALLHRREELLAHFPAAAVERTLTNTWRPSAVRLYRNWLTYILEQKAKRPMTAAPTWPLHQPVVPVA
jgi:homoserine O-succinyltransferase/O-acetyltransferase